MFLTPYQILAPLVSFLAIAYAWNLVMRRKKTLWEACLWTVFWGAVAVIALFPTSIDYLTAATGIKDRENAVVFTGLGMLFFMVFYLVMRLEEVERRNARIVRKIALREANLDSEKGEKDL